MQTASVILAAGRGSRMKGFSGNKTLLPLEPGRTLYEGETPMILHILNQLPPGPRALIVNHAKEAVMAATRDFSVVYREQPELNGTGGALLAAVDFLSSTKAETVVIAMGDVPLVRRNTYMRLIKHLKNHSLVVLGFEPTARKQYGVLAINGNEVERIIEWKYWHEYPESKKQSLRICNSGIYSVRGDRLIDYLKVLASRPHVVQKEINGRLEDVKEYFITDMVEYMHEDGLSTGYILAEDEGEVMGVDDPDALKRVQAIYGLRIRNQAGRFKV